MAESDKTNDSEPPSEIKLPSQSETTGAITDQIVKTPSPDELRLERFGDSLDDVDHVMDDDDEWDDEQDHIAHHPLLGMLAGRLGQPRRRGSTHKYDHLHPENSVLSVLNVDDCVALEQSFPEHERASREKIEYRLARCPELCLGLFTQPTKAEAERSVQTSQRKLVAMIMATRTPSPSVTEASMGVPENWKAEKTTVPAKPDPEAIGHQDVGGTIALHSLAVDSEHRNKGLATVLLKSYIQRIKDSRIAERIALLAHDNMEGFYGRFGFDNMGPSTYKYAGEDWNNMVLNFTDVEDD